MKKTNLKFIDNDNAIRKTDKKHKNETNDCVVKTFMNAFNISYDKAHAYVKKNFNRQDKKGTYFVVYKLAEMGGMKLVFSKDADSKCATKYLNGKTTKYIGSNPKACVKDNEGNAYGTYIKLTNPLYPLGKGEYAGYTVGKFRLQHPKGTYIILVRDHALCIKDGILVDNYSENDALYIMTNRDQRRALHIFQVIEK
tara:strand:+ start:787 stop:1377 length:591 start_codon:yes stop_codon:yes gene_type:complete